jgi:hypothetical protein
MVEAEEDMTISLLVIMVVLVVEVLVVQHSQEVRTLTMVRPLVKELEIVEAVAEDIQHHMVMREEVEVVPDKLEVLTTTLTTALREATV